jgi:hypothetical protein
MFPGEAAKKKPRTTFPPCSCIFLGYPRSRGGEEKIGTAAPENRWCVVPPALPVLQETISH